MTKDYKKIIQNTINEFDKIIKSNSIKNILFISNIFFVRDHHNFNKKYKYLITNYKFFYFSKIVLKFFIKRINSLRYSLRTFIQVNKANDYDYLFISHKIDNKKYLLDNDYIYGSMLSTLLKKDKKICLVFFNQTNFSIKNISTKIQNHKNVSYYFFNNKVNFIKDLKCFYILIELLLEIFKNKILINKKIFPFLIYSLFEEETLANVRISNFMKKISKNNFKKAILTYEGHSYERNIIKQLKNNTNSISVFAYLHSGIYETSHGIYQTDYPSSILPDKYLFSGKVGLEEFKKITNKYKKNDCEIFGSPRFFHPKNKNRKKKIFSFLFLPDGTNFETENYIDSAITLANLNKEYLVFIKVHPSQTLKVPYQIPKNLKFVDQKLEDFLERNLVYYAIYTSSSSIIQAILSGLCPIYYQYSSEQNTNPIYMFWKKKNYLKDLNDLCKLEYLNEIELYKDEIAINCKYYFEKLNLEPLLK